jgi:SAM-dependent MidA family methyltransferase
VAEGPGGLPDSPKRDPAEPITESEREREREVARRLAEAAGPEGVLRFDRFVEIALYGSGVGFYTSPEAAIGPAASFYTAAHVSDLFGKTLADRIWIEYGRLGRPPTFTVVEVGCADGTLSAQIVRSLTGRLNGHDKIRYVLVERSPALRARAVERVTPLADDSPVELRVADALSSDGPFVGVVVANELLDALPFRRLIRRGGAWRELGLRVRPDRLDWWESPGEAEPPAAELPDPGEEGAIAEMSVTSEGFLREVADHLVDGAAILLDYGGEEGPLLRDHPRGTLAAVRHHQPMSDPLAHPGLVDLSAFVNFTRVRRVAQAVGLVERAFRTQAEALAAWGLEVRTQEAIEAAEGEEEAVRVRLSVKNLLFGFSNFWALELAPRGGPPKDPSGAPGPGSPAPTS